MSQSNPILDPHQPASEQAMRLSGTVALHDQLYRYAEDLQLMVKRNGELEASHGELLESSHHLAQGCNEFRDLIHSSHDIHIITDTTGIILHSNPAARVVFNEHPLEHTSLRDMVLPSHLDNFDALRTSVLGYPVLADLRLDLELHSVKQGEQTIFVSAQILAVSGEGEVRQLHWIMRDMTRVRKAEFEQKLSSLAFMNAEEGMLILSPEGNVFTANPAYSHITGYQMEEIIGCIPLFGFTPKNRDVGEMASFWQVLREKGNWQGQIYNRMKNGEVFPEWLTVISSRDTDGSILNYLFIFSILSRLRQAEQQMANLAYHDALTGLPNRLLLHERIMQALVMAQRQITGFTLIFIDLDGFKQINDTLGHAIGDLVLQEVAGRLTDAVRKVDTVARLGGDEFIILAPGLTGDENIGQLCGKMINILRQPMQINEHEILISSSLGCAEYPRHGIRESTLMQRADKAMYRAKASGGNVHSVYSTA